MKITELRGASVADDIEHVGRFRLRWFREWPYLYDGTMEYEQHYLQCFADEPRSLLVLVHDDGDGDGGGSLMAVSTSLPLLADADILAGVPQLFREAGHDPADFYYYSETLVDPAHRGRGVGQAIYARREAEARRLGFSRVCFASVVRTADDPRRPASYRGNDRFWGLQGFARAEPPLTITFKWPTIQADGRTVEQANTLEFWLRDL
ncbi:MAG: GNAT family N-acetyltransferase [Planctomycetota bacterium]